MTTYNRMKKRLPMEEMKKWYIDEVCSEMQRRGIAPEDIPHIICKTGFMSVMELYLEEQLHYSIEHAVDEILETAASFDSENGKSIFPNTMQGLREAIAYEGGMRELARLLIDIEDSYDDFVTGILHYAGKKQFRLDEVIGYLHSNPGAKSSDVISYVSEQPDFYEDGASAHKSALPRSISELVTIYLNREKSDDMKNRKDQEIQMENEFTDENFMKFQKTGRCGFCGTQRCDGSIEMFHLGGPCGAFKNFLRDMK